MSLGQDYTENSIPSLPKSLLTKRHNYPPEIIRNALSGSDVSKALPNSEAEVLPDSMLSNAHTFAEADSESLSQTRNACIYKRESAYFPTRRDLILKNSFRLRDIVSGIQKGSQPNRLGEVLSALGEVYKECSEGGWDGYGAHAITEGSYERARKLIIMFAESFVNLPMPDITPEPNGDIALEWHRESKGTFAFSMDDNEKLTYAGIFDSSNTAYGKESFNDFIPQSIVCYIERLYSD